MNYKYSVVEDPNSEYKKIKLPDEISTIEYLLYDMESFRNPIFIDYINKVLSRESSRECIGGNICDLEIGEVYTKVTNNYVVEGMQDSCIIKTTELKEIIEIWVKENKEVLDS